MPTPSEKTLSALLASSMRIEKLLSKDKVKPDNTVKTLIGGKGTPSTSEMTASIEKNTKKTNVLLEDLINVTSSNKVEEAISLKSDINLVGSLGNGLSKFTKALQVIAKVPESAVDTLRAVMITLVFKNP